MSTLTGVEKCITVSHQQLQCFCVCKQLPHRPCLIWDITILTHIYMPSPVTTPEFPRACVHTATPSTSLQLAFLISLRSSVIALCPQSPSISSPASSALPWPGSKTNLWYLLTSGCALDTWLLRLRSNILKLSILLQPAEAKLHGTAE